MKVFPPYESIPFENGFVSVPVTVYMMGDRLYTLRKYPDCICTYRLIIGKKECVENVIGLFRMNQKYLDQIFKSR